MKSTTAESFEALPIPRKDFPQAIIGNYRVYRNSTEYTVIAATTALEAMQNSGIAAVHKIEREGLDYVTVLAPDAWKMSETLHTEVAPAANAAITPVEAAPTAVAAEAETDTPLSDTEVSKLLNN